jgi:hypothetical protein
MSDLNPLDPPALVAGLASAEALTPLIAEARARQREARLARQEVENAKASLPRAQVADAAAIASARRSGSKEPGDANAEAATKRIASAEREQRIANAASVAVAEDFSKVIRANREAWGAEAADALAGANADLAEAATGLQSAAARVAALRSFAAYLRSAGAQGRATEARMRDTLPGLSRTGQKGDSGFSFDEVLEAVARLTASLAPDVDEDVPAVAGV